MEKILKYIKSSTKISKILMSVWLFFVLILTLGMVASENRESIIVNIFLLVFMYVLLSSMFLIPAITINQSAKGKNNTSDPDKSKSIWVTTFLLCLFLGGIGAHRFYTGRKRTGFVYLFTI